MTIIPLGQTFPPGSSGQPGAHDGTGHPWPPIWPCCGWGLPIRLVTQPPVRSYRRLFTLTIPRREWRYLFCGAFRSGGLWPATPGSYPAPWPVAVRTFLPQAEQLNRPAAMVSSGSLNSVYKFIHFEFSPKLLTQGPLPTGPGVHPCL